MTTTRTSRAPRANRFGRLLRAVAAAAAIVVIVVGVPALMIALHLVPHGLPEVRQVRAALTGRDTGQLALVVLAAGIWLCWALFTVSLLAEAVALARRRPARMWPGLAAFQRPAAALLAAVVLGLHVAAVPVALAAAVPAAAVTQVDAAPGGVTPAAADAAAVAGVSPAGRSGMVAYRVRPRDTLWGIAAARLGSGLRYSEIAAANPGRIGPDGEVTAGIVLLIPADPGKQDSPAGPGDAGGDGAAGLSVTVRPGDTLSGIAAEHDTTWPALWQANRGQLAPNGHTFTDPNLIWPGQHITIPAPPGQDEAPAEPGDADGDGAGGSSVTVQPGDTLSGIAAEHDTTWPALWQANRGRPAPNGHTFTDPNLILPGQKILIPAPPGVPPDIQGGGRHHTPGAPATTRPDPARPTQQAADTPPTVTDAAPTVAATTPNAAAPAPAHTSVAEPQPAPGTAPTGVATPVTPGGVEVPALPESQAAQPTPLADPAGPVTAGPALPAASTPAGQPPIVTATQIQAPPAASAAAAPEASAEASAGTGGVSWPLLAGVGGAPLLAGLSFLAWQALRRRQRRWRRPGAGIVLPPPATRGVERALRTVGPDSADEVARLDAALRSLPTLVRQGRIDALPEVVAAIVGDGTVELVLARAAAAPAPWQADTGGLRWLLPDNGELPDTADQAGLLAPYPALVSVGVDAAGRQWLLDLEQVGGLSVSGPAGRGTDLLRFMAAELAHNTWSEMLKVTCYGLGEHLGELNPDRVTVADDRQLGAAAAAATRQAGRADADFRAGMPVLAARVAGEDREAPAPHILLVAAPATPADGGTVAGSDGLVAVAQHAAATGLGRTGTAVITCGIEQAGPVQQAVIDEDGVLRIPALGIEVTAHALPETEADQLAALLTAARNITAPTAPPAAATGSEAEPASADTAHETDRADPPTRQDTDRSGAAWDAEPDGETPSDAPTPAPVCGEATPTGPVAANAAAAPPVDELDADVSDWFDPECARPRITLLGPVSVTATGRLPETKPRVAWHTEVVAFLACRPRGVTAEQMWNALRPAEPYVPTRSTLRQAVSQARTWLGTDPETGTEYLPANPAAVEAIYRLRGALVDADLFTRLRRRAATQRGGAGIADLVTALSLVSGIPFDRRRRGGYAWLADDPLDHHYAAMIVDVAHQVARHHLANGDPQAAAAAAEIALAAGSYEDAPLLDLADACDARGMQAQVADCIRRIMANHDAEIEEELPPDTFATLAQRGWLATVS